MDSIDGFPYIEPSLHPCDEAYLIMVDDCFDVFLDTFGKNFIKYFCINIHKRNWPEVLFVGSLRGFGVSVIVGLYNELGSVPCVSILYNSLKSIGVMSSLKV